MGWGAVLLCLLGAVSVKPVLARASPQLAVDVAYANSGWMYSDSWLWGRDDKDPWGSEWCHVRRPGVPIEWQYSVGPNRQDDTGGDFDFDAMLRRPVPVREPRPLGDDVFPRFGPIRGWILPLARAPELLATCALLIAWCLSVPWARWERSPSLPRECASALALASFPAALAIGWWTFLARHDRSAKWSQPLAKELHLLVPATVAITASIALLAFLLALAWRLTRRAGASPADAN